MEQVGQCVASNEGTKKYNILLPYEEIMLIIDYITIKIFVPIKKSYKLDNIIESLL